MTTEIHNPAEIDLGTAERNTRTTEVFDVIRGVNDQPTGLQKREVTTALQAAHAYDPMAHFRDTLMETIYGKPVGPSGKRIGLMEAFIQSPDAANLLRDGIRMQSFLSFAEFPVVYPQIADVMASNRPQEEWLRDSVLGIIPPTKSGQPTPIITGGFEGGTTIKNTLYRALVEVNGDDIRFDRTGKIKQVAQELGRAFRMTEEYQVFNALTTAGNYIRAATTNDNDVAANTAATTFSALGLETAFGVISTSRDRRSGAYMGLMADTIIVAPRLAWAAKQLLFSDTLWRGGATSEVRGTGVENPYRSAIAKMIVSPWIGTTYQWLLFDSRYKTFKFQQVEPFNVYQEPQNEASKSFMDRDTIRYLGTSYFGCGFSDDRPFYFSSSVTAPTVS